MVFSILNGFKIKIEITMKLTSMKNFIAPVIFAVLIPAFMAAGCAKTGHYERGMELLKDKQYPEAITEFQKIDAGERQFRLAQSKIAYIQGLQAFNDSLFSAAEVQLVRVTNDDEFYHESQLMIDKINQRRLSSLIPETDTLIVREEEIGSKGEEKAQDKVKVEIETDIDITKKFSAQQRSLIENFQSAYTSGYSAASDSKKKYLDDMRSIAERLNALSYNAKEKDPEALELRKRSTAWMNKRIEFIQKLISDRSEKETNTSRSLKEEGDKLYYSVTQQLKKTK